MGRLVRRYAKENVAKIYVYLKDPYVKRIIREEKVTMITFVGSVGGLLGLFLGFSFISVIEILYMSFLALVNKMTNQTRDFKNTSTRKSPDFIQVKPVS